MDIFGDALLDYQKGRYTEDIITFSSLNEEDSIPIPHLFRTYKKMPGLEKRALEICSGTILDIGAGAGSHSLYLQKKGFEVTALDKSQGAVETCKHRGVKNVVHSEVLNYSGKKFDTLLLLMNGIGIVEKLENLSSYLNHFKTLLKPSGQILLDSSDIIYMFDQDEDEGYWIPQETPYYGEVTFTMQYKDKKSMPFEWLYVDYNTLKNAGDANGFDCELVSEGKHYDYLARLTLKT